MGILYGLPGSLKGIPRFKSPFSPSKNGCSAYFTGSEILVSYFPDSLDSGLVDAAHDSYFFIVGALYSFLSSLIIS